MNKIAGNAILRIGDKIPLGFYVEQHSRYPHAINFQRQELIISLCTSRISPGPFRIIIGADNLDDVFTLELGENTLVLNGTMHLSYNIADIYRQGRIAPAQPGKTTNQILEMLLRSLLNSDQGTILSLVNGSMKASNDYTIKLRKCFVNGLDALWKQDYEGFAVLIRHRGWGSTPTGDDFLLGYIMGLTWLIESWQMDLMEQREIVLSASIGTNPLINSFLRQAANYDTDRLWTNFLNSLAFNRSMRVMDDFNALRALGSSSGDDMLSGFLICVLDNMPGTEGKKILEKNKLKKVI